MSGATATLTDWAPWLIDASVKATVWLIVVAIALRLGRRRSTAARHAFAVAAAAGVPCIFVLGLSPLPEAIGWKPLERAAPMVRMVNDATTAGSRSSGGSAAGGPDASPAASRVGEPPWERGPRLSVAAARGVLVLVWGLGAGVTAMGLLAAGCRRPRVLRRARPAPRRHLLAARVEHEARRAGLRRAPAVRLLRGATPMVCGLRRPTVVLPEEAEEWPDDRLAVVIAHELAHVRRRDLLWTLFAEWALVPLWWHPLARRLRRGITELRECACDDRVVASGRHEPADYAEHLLALMAGTSAFRAGVPVLPALDSTTRERRFRHLLDATASRTPATGLGIGISSLLVLAVVIPGTLLMSCATARPEPFSIQALDPGDPPAIPGLPADTGLIEISLKVVEVEVEALDAEAPEGWEAIRTGAVRVLSPEDGWRLFHPERKGTDLMTAPSLTIEPGRTGTVAVIREFIHPTRWEVDPSGDDPPVPADFRTTDIGVIVKVAVRPTEDPDTIAVDLEPTIREFLGFEDHPDVDGAQVPRFRTRRAAFDQRLRNGSWFIVGERSDLEKIEDRVPVLGDIPVVGRLFRARREIEHRRLAAVQVTASPAHPSQAGSD